MRLEVDGSVATGQGGPEDLDFEQWPRARLQEPGVEARHFGWNSSFGSALVSTRSTTTESSTVPARRTSMRSG